MANPVILSDLEARWRPLVGDDERTVAESLLADAWAIANAQLPMLSSAVDANTVSTEVVRAVIATMVIRVLRNPNGVRQWSVDDYSETRDASVAAGSLYLSADELSLLTGAMGRPRRRAFTITPYSEPARSAGSEWPYR